jgi:hypothetical protein
MNNSSIHEYSGGALIAAHRGSRVRVAIYPPPPAWPKTRYRKIAVFF